MLLILEYILSFPANAILCNELRHGVQFYSENFQEFIELKAKEARKNHQMFCFIIIHL